MLCPRCHSDHVRRSQRHGPYEGILLRLAGQAPFRCRHCGFRFTAAASDDARRWHGGSRGLVSYLGLDSGDAPGFLILSLLLAILAGFALIGSLLLIGEGGNGPVAVSATRVEAVVANALPTSGRSPPEALARAAAETARAA